MASLDFPSSPTNGQTYSSAGVTWTYNSTYNVWNVTSSGPVGYSGSQGYTGSKGDIGYSGSLGYTGSAGTNGTNGYTGSQGYTGSASTVIGYTGSQGVIGYTGSAGTNGTNGYTGSAGTAGYTGSLGYSGSAATINWMYKTANYTAVNNDGILADTTSASFTVTLPASPTTGTYVSIVDVTSTFATNPLTVSGNGQTLQGLTYTSLVLNVTSAKVDLIYEGSYWAVATTSGTRGYTGSLGYTGSKGTDGYTGSQGYSGSVGYTGSQGYNGSQGYTGSAGYTGSQGYTGSASTVIGYTGSKGDIGYTGSIPAALTATSLALGGATLGTNALAVTGTTQLNSALNYGGVTLSNAVTGTGNMVLSASPTFTGTIIAAGATFSSPVTINDSTEVQLTMGGSNGSQGRLRTQWDGTGAAGRVTLSAKNIAGTLTDVFRINGEGVLSTLLGPLNYGGVTLSNSVTGTGSMVLSASPTLTGTPTVYQGTAAAVAPLRFNTVQDASATTWAIGQGNSTTNFYISGYSGGWNDWFSMTQAGVAQFGGKVGIGMTPSNVLDITQSQNGNSIAMLLNNTAGTAAMANFYAKNSIGSVIRMGMHSGSFTTSGVDIADAGILYADGAGGLAIGTNTQPIRFYVGSTTEVARFDTSGNLKLTNLLDLSGASAGQIKFPATQNASADANTLDDYEEGTFTPVFSFAGGTTGMATSISGNYVKIGKVVTVSIYFILTTKGSSTGQARFTSLPYTSASSQYGTGCIVNNLYGVTHTGQLALSQWNTPGTTTVECWTINNGAQSALTDTGFSNSTQFYPLFTYITT